MLYSRYAGEKRAFFKRDTLSSLNVKVDQHGEMPDLVIYLPERNGVALFDAAGSNGPAGTKRQAEPTELFARPMSGLVYVSCFPNRVQFRKYVDEITSES